MTLDTFLRRTLMGLALASLVSVGAWAQTPSTAPSQDLQNDQKDINHDNRRDLNKDRQDRNADQRDINHDRRDLNLARADAQRG